MSDKDIPTCSRFAVLVPYIYLSKTRTIVLSGLILFAVYTRFSFVMPPGILKKVILVALPIRPLPVSIPALYSRKELQNHLFFSEPSGVSAGKPNVFILGSACRPLSTPYSAL